jgi:hypothetical protein
LVPAANSRITPAAAHPTAASRNRSGAYLISLCMGTAIFGMFFFLTLFVQDAWGTARCGQGSLPAVRPADLGDDGGLAAGR